MAVVVGTAFRRALAGLVLCFGLFALLFTLLDRSGSRPETLRGGPRVPLSLLEALTPSRSPWDIPIAVGLVAVSVIAAALIYPARRPLAAPTSPR
jgi:ABC-type antimicrobial peptide transport system permease subunit